MPVRFTCRLIVVPGSEPDKFRVRYGWLGEGMRWFEFTGPTMVQPPAGEMTAAELDAWERSVHLAGFSACYSPDSVDAPLVEAKKTIEDEIAKGAVRWQLAWAKNAGSGELTFGVTVQSSYRGVIPGFTLSTVWEHHTPQPVPNVPAEFGAEEVGGEESMFRRTGPIGGDSLPPNIPISFVYDLRGFSDYRSRAAALSPEHHWIALNTDGHEFDRIPGSVIAGFLESEE